MPTPKMTKIHFQTDLKTALCGTKSLVVVLSTDRDKVDCGNCVSRLPALMAEGEVSDLMPDGPPIPVFEPLVVPTTDRVHGDMTTKSAKVSGAKSEAIAGLLYLDPFKVHFRGGWNPRTDYSSVPAFADQLEEEGQRTPISVYEDQGFFWCESGHRRTLAARIIQERTHGEKFSFIVATLNTRRMNEVERLVQAMIGNDVEPLSPHDEANAFQRLLDGGITHKSPEGVVSSGEAALAKRLHKGPQYISSRLNILIADTSLLRKLDEKAITVTELHKILQTAQREKISQEEAYAKAMQAHRDLRTAQGKKEQAEIDEKARLEQEEKDRIAKEKADRDATRLVRENARRIAKGLPPLPTADTDPETDKLVEDAKIAHGKEMQDLHVNADTTPPVVSRGDYTVTGSLPDDDDGIVSSGVFTPEFHFDDKDEYALAVEQGRDTSALTEPYGRLSAILRSIFTDSGKDKALPTLLMAMRWFIRSCGAVAVHTALEQVMSEERAAQAKVIPPVKASPLGAIHVPTAVTLGEPGSAQAALAALRSSSPE